MSTILITGANRGIGLAITELWLERGQTVIATARAPHEAKALQALAGRYSDRLRLAALDVTSDASCETLARELGSKTSIDIVVNNAGISGSWKGFSNFDPRELMQVYDTNAVGPLRVTRALLDHLTKRSAKLIHMTSQMGSIEDNRSGGAYAYRMSKAALNMAGKTLALELASKGIISVVVHPGWVQTDMGGRSAPTRPQQSAQWIVSLAEKLTMADSGKFLHADGRELPW